MSNDSGWLGDLLVKVVPVHVILSTNYFHLVEIHKSVVGGEGDALCRGDNNLIHVISVDQGPGTAVNVAVADLNKIRQFSGLAIFTPGDSCRYSGCGVTTTTW